MNHTRLILLFLIASSFFAGANVLECGDRQIENCKECGKETNLIPAQFVKTIISCSYIIYFVLHAMIFYMVKKDVKDNVLTN